jgi:hypothetical protein
MPQGVELIWLAHALVFIGSMGLGWTLMGCVHQIRKTKTNHER